MKPVSAFYVERNADAIALRTIVQLGVTIPIKGPRQVGKSSLLMRIIQAARNAGKRVAYLDFQQLNNSVLNDEELFFRHFCSWISDVLELEDKVSESFRLNLTTIQRCDRYLQRHILKGLGSPLVLAMDEVDRVFDTNFRNDFFGMLRSWHVNKDDRHLCDDIPNAPKSPTVQQRGVSSPLGDGQPLWGSQKSKVTHSKVRTP